MVDLESIRSEELSIVSAVETLSNIADLDLNEFPHNDSAKEHVLSDDAVDSLGAEGIPILSRTVTWLHRKNAERILSTVCANFRTVLDYLKQFYHTEQGKFIRRESVEGIKTIMVLVSEAADNLDRYTKIFFGSAVPSVKESKEYIDLFSFYKKKIAPLAQHSGIISWVGSLPIQRILSGNYESASLASGQKEIAQTHQFVDLEGVKRDSDYELFFLKRPDGTRYFTSKLIRNMKLISRVEEAVRKSTEEDIDISFDIYELENMFERHDIQYIIDSSWKWIDGFFNKAGIGRQHPLIKKCFSALVALMYSEHVLETKDMEERGYYSLKIGSDYVRDFKSLFLKLLSSDEYKRLLAYPPKGEGYWERQLLEVTHAISRIIVEGAPLEGKLVNAIRSIASYGMREAIQEVDLLEEGFIKDLSLTYIALHTASGDQGKEQITKLLQHIEQDEKPCFEPLFFQDTPTHLFDLQLGRDMTHVVRLACPTRQESIDSASLSEIFKDALRSQVWDMRKEEGDSKSHRPWLILNLQDRMSWKDAARTHTLEEIELNPEVNPVCRVMTLPRSGDFYWQKGLWGDAVSASVFISALAEHMAGQRLDGSGVYWSLYGTMLGKSDCEWMAARIHEKLFDGKKMLTRTERQQCIEYMQLFSVLFAISDINPSHLFVTCKDGLDITVSFLAELYVLIEAMRGRNIFHEETEWISSWLHGFSLIHRGRILFPERHTRMISFFKSMVRLLYDDRESAHRLIHSLNSDEESFLHHLLMCDGAFRITAHASMGPSHERYFSRRY